MRVTGVDEKYFTVNEKIETYNSLVNERNQLPEIKKDNVKYGVMNYEIFFSSDFPKDDDGNFQTPIPTFNITSLKGDGIPSKDVLFEVPHIYDISLINNPEDVEKEVEDKSRFNSKVEGSEYAPEKDLFVKVKSGEIYKGAVAFAMPKNADNFIFTNISFDEDKEIITFYKGYW